MNSHQIARVFLASFVLTAAAGADSIKLRSGVLLVGTVTEATSQGLTFKRADNGGVLELKWDHLAPESVESVKKDKHLIVENEEEVTVPATMVRYRLAGAVDDRMGENMGRQGDRLMLKTKGVMIGIPTVDIMTTTVVNVPAYELYTPDEFYQQKSTEMAPGDDPKRNLELAMVLRRVRDYDRALKHLQIAKEKGGGDQMDVIDKQIKDITLRKENKAEADMLGQIDVFRNRGEWKKALDLVEKFAKDYPQTKLKSEFEDKKLRLTRDRETSMVKEVARLWYQLLRQLAANKARDRSVSFAQMKEYCEEGLGKEIRSRVAKAFSLKPEEVDNFFKLRLKNSSANSSQSAGYGEGTWLLDDRAIMDKTTLGKEQDKEKAKKGGEQGEADKVKDAMRKRIDDYMKRAKQAASAAQGKGGSGDGLPSEEDWWKEAETPQRELWISAYYAEKGGDMETYFAYLSPCDICGGAGKTSENDPTSGKVIARVCFFCHGKKWKRSIKYR